MRTFFKKRKERKMRILYINNAGAGWADYIDVPQSQTVEELFKEKMSARKPDDFLIRVNRQPVSKDQILRENDRVTITPLKIEGAII
jgi:sulfur carrier protein ThiS